MKTFISKSIDIEELAAKVYHAFVNNQKCNTDLRSLWQGMAKDEEDHAQALKLADRLPKKDLFSSLRADCPNPDELTQQLEEMFTRAKEEEMDEYEMLKVAVALENGFHKFHATYALVFNDESLRKTFEALSRADAMHLEGLNKYIQDFKARHK